MGTCMLLLFCSCPSIVLLEAFPLKGALGLNLEYFVRAVFRLSRGGEDDLIVASEATGEGIADLLNRFGVDWRCAEQQGYCP